MSVRTSQSSFATIELVRLLLRKLNEIEDCYTRLILLVGPSRSGKTRVLEELKSIDNAKFAYLNVNLLLSERLVNLSRFERQRDLQKIFEDAVSEVNADVLLLDNTEILFDINLAQDPIKCLVAIGRRRIVIATWNGQCANGQLTYAEPEHPEFKEYQIRELDAFVQPIGKDTAK